MKAAIRSQNVARHGKDSTAVGLTDGVPTAVTSSVFPLAVVVFYLNCCTILVAVVIWLSGLPVVILHSLDTSRIAHPRALFFFIAAAKPRP